MTAAMLVLWGGTSGVHGQSTITDDGSLHFKTMLPYAAATRSTLHTKIAFAPSGFLPSVAPLCKPIPAQYEPAATLRRTTRAH